MTAGALRQRLTRLEPCRSCGLSLLDMRRKLEQTLATIRETLPKEQAEAIIADLRRIWTGK